MKPLIISALLLLPSVSFATEGGDLLTAATGTNLRSGNSLNAPVIRTINNDEVLYRLPGEPDNGYIKVRLTDGSEVFVFEKYTMKIVDKQPIKSSTETSKK